MTNETKTPAKKKPKRTKMRAVQQLYHENVFREEGEVFIYVGDELPDELIAVRVSDDTPLGLPEPVKTDPLGKTPPPPWTTKGFVDKANRDAGREEADA